MSDSDRSSTTHGNLRDSSSQQQVLRPKGQSPVRTNEPIVDAPTRSDGLPTVNKGGGSSPARAGQQNVRNARLPVMPLAVLLPQLGDLGALSGMAASIEARLAELEALRTTADEEWTRETAAEDSMLNQVMRWLTVGDEEERGT